MIGHEIQSYYTELAEVKPGSGSVIFFKSLVCFREVRGKKKRVCWPANKGSKRLRLISISYSGND